MGVPYVKEEMKQAGDGADKKLMRAKKEMKKLTILWRKILIKIAFELLTRNTDWIGRERNNSEVRDFAVR